MTESSMCSDFNSQCEDQVLTLAPGAQALLQAWLSCLKHPWMGPVSSLGGGGAGEARVLGWVGT